MIITKEYLRQVINEELQKEGLGKKLAGGAAALALGVGAMAGKGTPSQQAPQAMQKQAEVYSSDIIKKRLGGFTGAAKIAALNAAREKYNPGKGPLTDDEKSWLESYTYKDRHVRNIHAELLKYIDDKKVDEKLRVK